MKKSIPLLVGAVFLLTVFCTCDDLGNPGKDSNRGDKALISSGTNPLSDEEIDASVFSSSQINQNRSVLNSDIDNGSNYDRYGDVETKIWECKSENQELHWNIVCLVDDDYVVVGGGAHVDYSYYGAYLFESRPLENLTGWVASSKAHGYHDFHDLTVYAIGMKLRNVSRNFLRSNMAIQKSTSDVELRPSAKARVEPDYVIIGGGAEVNWNGSFPGNLLVKSYHRLDSTGYHWYAESKCHQYFSAESITAYAIGMKEYIPGFGYLKITRFYVGGDSVSTGVADSATVDFDSVISCIGANSVYEGNMGRLIFSMKPLEGHVAYAATKDHQYYESGYVCVTGMRIKKDYSR